MSPAGDQLALGLGHPPALGRVDFVAGACNRDALALIDAWPEWPQEPVLLSGPEGSGKTHLVQIWSDASGASIKQATSLRTEAEAIEPGHPLAVEDIDRAWHRETALFHLLNRAREAGSPLLLTSRDPAIASRCGLPDLASRLRAARPVSLDPPDDAFLTRVLVKLFSDRQLTVSAATLEFIVRRMERTYAAAARIVARMDEWALATGKPLGRGLAGAVLATTGADNDEFDPVSEAK